MVFRGWQFNGEGASEGSCRFMVWFGSSVDCWLLGTGCSPFGLAASGNHCQPRPTRKHA